MMNPSASSPADDVSHAGAVLLVDDEEALLEIYAAILEPHFAVEKAGNAQEADVLLGQKTFKVIVADHSMPGETGLSFLARARVALPHVQFVLVTGNMTPEMQRSAKESNLLFAFLTKPISITELLSVVQSAALAHDTRLAATK
jgi:DNA-binding NtrC family response regulator